MFGMIGEYFKEAAIPFLPKILQIYNKKLKDIGDVTLAQAFADALGTLYHFMLKNIAN